MYRNYTNNEQTINRDKNVDLWFLNYSIILSVKNEILL